MLHEVCGYAEQLIFGQGRNGFLVALKSCIFITSEWVALVGGFLKVEPGALSAERPSGYETCRV